MSSSSTAAGYRRPQAATECDKLFIGGKWVKPSTGDVIEVHSPATGAYVGKVPLEAKADVDAAVAAARTAFAVARSPWPATPPAQRAAVIGAAVKLSTHAYRSAATRIRASAGSSAPKASKSSVSSRACCCRWATPLRAEL